MNRFKGWCSRLSVHAAQRLAERTHIREPDLLGLLDGEKSVPVGIEERTNRLHRLVYSVNDEECFVAVQDMGNGEVITVLTLEYHENLAWKISSESQNLARKLALRWVRQTAEGRPPESTSGVQIPRTSLRLRAYLTTIEGAWHGPTIKAKNLGSLSISACDRPLDALHTSIAFCEEVRHRLKARGIETSLVRKIVGQMGKNFDTAEIFEYGADFLAQGAGVNDSA